MRNSLSSRMAFSGCVCSDKLFAQESKGEEKRGEEKRGEKRKEEGE